MLFIVFSCMVNLGVEPVGKKYCTVLPSGAPRIARAYSEFIARAVAKKRPPGVELVLSNNSSSGLPVISPRYVFSDVFSEDFPEILSGISQ